MKNVVKFFGLILLILSIISIYSCKKDKPMPPQITTANVTEITYTTAICGGNLIDQGSSDVLSMGICWDTSPTPTIASKTTSQDIVIGSFISSIVQLNPNTKYFVRAYATNSIGTSYGNEVSFTTNALAVPSLTTNTISSIKGWSAISGGTKITENGSTITAKGVCWSTTSNPTINDLKTTDGNGTDMYTSTITDLSPGSTYHIRAYATNSVGTGYGEDLSFSTLAIPIAVIDIDGNGYYSVIIGTQVWLRENLKTTKYNDGTPIPLVVSDLEWNSLSTNAYCWYNNDPHNKDKNGALYNWKVVDRSMNGDKNVCPAGWHVPAKAEWTTLFDYLSLNGYSYGGSGDLIAKSMAALSGWDIDLTPGNVGNDQITNNSSGFTGLPSGLRRDDGNSFGSAGHETGWWAVPDDYSLGYSYWYNTIYSSTNYVFRGNTSWNTGVSVRCVKD